MIDWWSRTVEQKQTEHDPGPPNSRRWLKGIEIRWLQVLGLFLSASLTSMHLFFEWVGQNYRVMVMFWVGIVSYLHWPPCTPALVNFCSGYSWGRPYLQTKGESCCYRLQSFPLLWPKEGSEALRDANLDEIWLQYGNARAKRWSWHDNIIYDRRPMIDASNIYGS